MTDSILIIGASRGIGLGLVRQFAQRGARVIATARTPATATALADIAGVRVEPLDLDDPAAIDAFPARLGGTRPDVLIVNAGVSGPDHRDAAKATRDEVGALFFTNAVAPIRLARALLPHLAPGATIGFMSSVLGSVSQTGGQHEVYSASKAALNLLTRSFAASVAGRNTVLSLHPGWVKTDMGGPNAAIDVETSTRGLADVITAAKGRLDHRYVDYAGREIGW